MSAADDPSVAVLAEQRDGYPKAAGMGWVNIFVHLGGCASLLALLIWAGWWLVPAAIGLGLVTALLGLGLGSLAGLFIADLLSGVAHWAFDTWFDERHPVFHRMVLVVREHHIAPQAMFGYPFYNDAGQLSGLNLILVAPIVIPITLWSYGSVLTIATVWACMLQSLCFVFMLEFHKCGHRRPARGLLGALQRGRLLLHPRHHWLHHQGLYDTHYCLINGWADHVMDALGGWRALERLCQRLTGATPRANDDVWLATWLPSRRRVMWLASREMRAGRIRETSQQGDTR